MMRKDMCDLIPNMLKLGEVHREQIVATPLLIDVLDLKLNREMAITALVLEDLIWTVVLILFLKITWNHEGQDDEHPALLRHPAPWSNVIAICSLAGIMGVYEFLQFVA